MLTPTILVAGGSGLLGSKLVKKLKQKNLSPVLLSTQKQLANNSDTVYWNPEEGIFPDIDLSNVKACFNFCGAGIFDYPITDARKKVLIDSRVKPIEFLMKIFKQNGSHPDCFISASATGYYPNICLNELTEGSTGGDSFISGLVHHWEYAAHHLEHTANKVCIFRIGIVLAPDGGFLEQLAKPVKLFAGAIPGSGRQMISWVHIDDVADMMVMAMEQGWEGTFNATAPHPETLENITRLVAKTLGKPLWLPNIPVWVLKLVFGKERAELLLTNQKVSSRKAVEQGYRFQYLTIEEAIPQLLA